MPYNCEQIVSLGKCLNAMLKKSSKHELQELLWNEIDAARSYNRWFTAENICLRLSKIADCLANYSSKPYNYQLSGSKVVGMYSEGRIPLEEFFNMLAIVQLGSQCIYKHSANTDKVLEAVWEITELFVPEWTHKVEFTNSTLKNTDVLYICGSGNNTALRATITKHKRSCFEQRNYSAAIIDGNETDTELLKLAGDVFGFFGQGSGNVRKIFVPENYQFNHLYEVFESWYKVMEHSPWANNYQYHQSVFLMNRIPHFDNGFLLLRQSVDNKAPLGVLYYETYHLQEDLHHKLKQADYFKIYGRDIGLNNRGNFGDWEQQMLAPSEKLIALLQ